MKFIICISLFFTSNLFAITDESLKDTDKYNILNINPIKKSSNFNVLATFYPPIGKKLNNASYVKIWEKENKEWRTIEEITPGNQLDFSGEYHLEKLIAPKNKNSELAIEIEFIHCSHSGGAMFNGKIYWKNYSKRNGQRKRH